MKQENIFQYGKVNRLGHPLTWIKHGTTKYYHWYGELLCTVELKDGKYVKSFPPSMQTLKVAEVVTEYDTLKQAHETILEYFKTGKFFFKNLEVQIKEKNDAKCKERETEKAKYYHLELDDLTPEHDLLYADILSTRALNLLKAARVRTLKELAKRQRADIAKYRNCGRKSLDELEKLLNRVGLTWGMKDSITLSTLIEKLQSQLKEHPEYANRMVYFDALHIDGTLTTSGQLLELY